MEEIEHWMKILHVAVNDIALTKQYSHIQHLITVLRTLNTYIIPFEESIKELVNSSDKAYSAIKYEPIAIYLPKLSTLIKNDAQFELKGSSFFIDKLAQYQAKVVSIKEEYSTKLDEQRNFWGFTLVLFSVFVFPALFTLGYW